MEGSPWVWPRPIVFTAADLVSRLPVKMLASLFDEMGNEPRAELCASAIAHWRGAGRHRRKIQSTLELRYVIDRAVSALEGTLPDHLLRNRGKRRKLKMAKTEHWISARDRQRTLQEMERSKPWNPAVLGRCFQALRCAVNNEMTHVRDGIAVAGSLLAPGGTLVSLAFQPTEDKALRKFARVRSMRGSAQRLGVADLQQEAERLSTAVSTAEEALSVPMQVAGPDKRVSAREGAGEGQDEGVEATRPTIKEVRKNPRSRSARLHVVQIHSPRVPSAWKERQQMELDWLQGRMEQIDDTTEQTSRAGSEEGESDRAGESRPPRAFAGAHDWSQDGDGGLELLQRLSSEFPEAAGRLTGRKVFFPSWVEMAMVKSDKTKRWQRRMHRAEVR